MIIFTYSVRILKIARGNSTALVYNCPIKARKKVSKKLLKKVEQVGFIETKKNLPNLEMMGGELCINATLAFASTLNKEGKLYTSGIKTPISYKNNKGRTTIKLLLPYKKEKDTILFNGIGFVINNKIKISKLFLSRLCKKYNLPAFGAIFYKKNKITPYVYVKETDSFVKETACGSGSIAFSIFSDKSKIIQPTGKSLNIKIKNDKILINGEVNEIKQTWQK